MKKPVVVVLAGGEGKRFKPITVNKTMLPLFGKPLIEYTFEMLGRVGLTDVIVSTSEANHEFISSYKGGLSIKAKRQNSPLGMADALVNVESLLTGLFKYRPSIIMNAADIVEDSLLGDMLGKVEKGSYALVAGMKQSEYFSGGYLKVDGDKVGGIVEKPGAGREPSDMVNLVFHYFSRPEEFTRIVKEVRSKEDDTYEVALNRLMRDNDVGFVSYDGYWRTIKYNFNVLDMMDLFLRKKAKPYTAKTAKVSAGAVVDGKVYIDEGAIVQEAAIVRGPAYIGRNVLIGSHTLVRESVVEEGSVVGFGTEVARSYIGPGCELHHNYIGDSILESRVNPSYGTCTANYRFDRKEVFVVGRNGDRVGTGRDKFGAIIADGAFLGINTSILPGRTIGANARCLPNSVIRSSLAKGAFLE